MVRVRAAVVVPCTVVMAVAVAAAAHPRTSERYAFSTYREEADRLSVFVDGFPASQRLADGYVPVSVAIAALKYGKAVTFVPESFTLVDSAGNEVPAAGYQELTRDYDKLGFDRSLIRMRPIVVGSYVAQLRPVAALFYPPPSSGPRIPRVELGAFTWFADTLYFPHPPAGLGGVLTLRVAVPGGDPVEVRFVAMSDE